MALELPVPEDTPGPLPEGLWEDTPGPVPELSPDPGPGDTELYAGPYPLCSVLPAPGPVPGLLSPMPEPVELL